MPPFNRPALGCGACVPQLLREPLDAAIEPARAALILRGDDRPFALLGAWAGGGAILGSEPIRAAGPDEDLFAVLDELPRVGDATAGAAPPRVGGGWFGFLGFEARHRVERGHPPPPRPVPLGADGALAYYDHVLRMDPDGRWWFEALATPGREDAIERRRDELAARLARPPAPRPFATREWRWIPSPAGHAGAVEACRTRIAAGDLFQANLCMRLEGRLDGDAFDLFAAAAQALPTDRAAFVAGPWGTVASLSPELFLTRSGRTVRSAPIKGTRPADRREELARSEKDRAENVMIVDLVRNDLGRVCRPGTVRVTALAEVRPHAGVWHMVSEVEGELRDGVGDAGLLRATFPPGSVTGAPKLAALDVIAELESTGREAYTGAIGFASPLAGLELSVAIRSFEVRGPRIWLGAGGGIVADSDGEEEAREAAAKAAPLLKAIGAVPPPAAAVAVARTLRVVRRGPKPTPRPDPAAGLYETVLVERGDPRELDAHLQRLAAQRPCALRTGAPGRPRRARPHRSPRPRARAAADRPRPRRGTGGRSHAARPARPRDAAAGRRPRRARPAQVARPHAARGPRGRRPGHDPAAARRRRPGARGQPRQHRRPRAPTASSTRRRTTAASSPASPPAAAGAQPRPLTLADLDRAAAVYVASALRGLSPAARTPAA